MRKRKTTPWARRRRRVYIIVALIAAIVTPAVVWRLGLKTAVREELALLRAEGIPTTQEELAKWEAQFPALETVSEYSAITAAYARLPFEQEQDFPSFRLRHDGAELFAVPYDDVTLGVMTEFVELNRETLRLLREARLAATSGDSPKTGVEINYEEFVALCCAQACVLANQGDGAGAAEAILDGLVMLSTTYAKPWCHSIPIPEDGVGQLMRALASSAGRTPLPEAQLRTIQAILSPADRDEALRRNAIYRSAAWVVDLSSEQLDSPPAEAADLVLGFFDRHMSESIRNQRLRFGLFGKSVKEQQAEFAAMKELGISRDFIIQGPPMYLPVSVAGIEVLIYKQQHGRLPESLEILAREGLDLVDFYTEKPLIYQPDGTSFQLYSVGSDLKDDGGTGRDDVLFKAVLPEIGGPESAVAGNH